MLPGKHAHLTACSVPVVATAGPVAGAAGEEARSARTACARRPAAQVRACGARGRGGTEAEAPSSQRNNRTIVAPRIEGTAAALGARPPARTQSLAWAHATTRDNHANDHDRTNWLTSRSVWHGTWGGDFARNRRRCSRGTLARPNGAVCTAPSALAVVARAWERPPKLER